MTTQVKYLQLNGGLDLINSPIAMKDGVLLDCINFEQVFGLQGYNRIDGYERFDGRLEPHSAEYWVQNFDNGTAAIVAGDIVTGTSATAEVLIVEIESGSWATTDCKGRLILGNVTGTWADNEEIKVTSTKCLANGVTYRGSLSETLDTTYTAIAIETLRAKITAVPGEGAILGCATYKDGVVAVRNIVGSTSATMFKSSASGWSSVRTGLYPGGRYDFEQANFSGSSTTIHLYGVDGKNRPFRWDGTTFTQMAPIYGTQATSTTSIAVGTGSKAFTCTETLRGFVTGQTYIVWSAADAANWMIGTFTSYTTNVLTINVTSSGGSGTFTDWEIGLSDFSDKPFAVTSHRDHLFLCYPQGQLQTSNLGDAMVYTTTAAVFGLGDDLVGMVSTKGGTAAIYCKNKTMILTGADKTSWSMSVNSLSSGAKLLTPAELAGVTMAVDTRGLTSLQATLNFGAFEMSVFSRMVKPYLDPMLSRIVSARVCKTKSQYRMYFDNGEVLTCALLTPNAQVTPQDVAFTKSIYKHIPSCTYSGQLVGEEALLFGTTDGYVMREDVGNSFDGQNIDSAIRLGYTSLKSPSNKKRFRKMLLETTATNQTEIYFRQLFDYADGNYEPSIQYSTNALGGGGYWNTDEYDTFRWSMPAQGTAEANIDGVGRNMSLLIWHSSALDKSFNLQGIILHYSTMGLAR